MTKQMGILQPEKDTSIQRWWCSYWGNLTIDPKVDESSKNFYAFGYAVKTNTIKYSSTTYGNAWMQLIIPTHVDHTYKEGAELRIPLPMMPVPFPENQYYHYPAIGALTVLTTTNYYQEINGLMTFHYKDIDENHVTKQYELVLIADMITQTQIPGMDFNILIMGPVWASELTSDRYWTPIP